MQAPTYEIPLWPLAYAAATWSEGPRRVHYSVDFDQRAQDVMFSVRVNTGQGNTSGFQYVVNLVRPGLHTLRMSTVARIEPMTEARAR